MRRQRRIFGGRRRRDSRSARRRSALVQRLLVARPQRHDDGARGSSGGAILGSSVVAHQDLSDDAGSWLHVTGVTTETAAGGPTGGSQSSIALVTAGDAELLARGAVEVLPAGELERKLALGRPLRVKLGIDPTAPDIHLGHTVVLGKLRAFQDAGHVVVLIIGDFTARIGDPSGRSELRPMLSAGADRGERAHLPGAGVQGPRRAIRGGSSCAATASGSTWTWTSLLALVRTTTVGQLLERDDFAKRLARGDRRSRCSSCSTR